MRAQYAILMLVFTKKHVDFLVLFTNLGKNFVLKKLYRTSSLDATFEMMQSGSVEKSKKNHRMNKILMEFLIG